MDFVQQLTHGVASSSQGRNCLDYRAEIQLWATDDQARFLRNSMHAQRSRGSPLSEEKIDVGCGEIVDTASLNHRIQMDCERPA